MEILIKHLIKLNLEESILQDHVNSYTQVSAQNRGVGLTKNREISKITDSFFEIFRTESTRHTCIFFAKLLFENQIVWMTFSINVAAVIRKSIF